MSGGEKTKRRVRAALEVALPRCVCRGRFGDEGEARNCGDRRRAEPLRGYGGPHRQSVTRTAKQRPCCDVDVENTSVWKLPTGKLPGSGSHHGCEVDADTWKSREKQIKRCEKSPSEPWAIPQVLEAATRRWPVRKDRAVRRRSETKENGRSRHCEVACHGRFHHCDVVCA